MLMWQLADFRSSTDKAFLAGFPSEEVVAGWLQPYGRGDYDPELRAIPLASKNLPTGLHLKVATLQTLQVYISRVE